MDPDLSAAIEQDHRALDALVMGDPEPKKRMFSRRDDVTVANPIGPPVRGRSALEDTLDRVTSRIAEGKPHEFQRISEYATADLAYVVEIERTGVRLADSDEIKPFSLRATTVWRREDGEWRIAHRHADPITTPRPLESIFEQ